MLEINAVDFYFGRGGGGGGGGGGTWRIMLCW